MTDDAAYDGRYYFMGMVFDVAARDGELLATVPGVPPGYEIVLEPVAPDQVRLRGGQFEGGTAAFVRDSSGAVVSLSAAGIEFVRATPETAAGLPVIERHPAPALDLTPDKAVAFNDLLDQLAAHNDGGWIDYDLPWPRHEFIQYLNEQDRFIFHGSGRADIDVFAPVRKSIELRDDSGRGNLQAVYGTHDGLWAMFFAIVDREKLDGSIRNGVMVFSNRLGEQLAVYNFSVNQHQLADRPWREGTLYLLPRETFVRLELAPGVPANEWASEVEVTPVARLRVRPEDFPFLERIGGHDDGELLRAGALGKAIREAALSAALDDDGLTVTVPAAMSPDLAEYVSLHRVLLPAATFTIEESGEAAVLRVTSLPPAWRQVLSNDYADLLRDHPSQSVNIQ